MRLNFFLSDVGEVHALLPVLRELDVRKVHYHVWTIGIASRFFVDHKRACALDVEFNEEGLRSPPRFDPFLDSLIANIVDKMGRGVLVSGMARCVQSQVLKKYREVSSLAIGYFDPFNYITKEHVSYKFMDHLRHLIVPMEPIAQHVRKHFPKVDVSVLGNPTLEEWVRCRGQSKAKLRNQLGIDAEDRVVVYVGGYDSFYLRAFERFIHVFPQLSIQQGFVAIHPRSTGEFEREMLSQCALPNLSIFPQEYKTKAAVVVADVVISTQSTVGVQALCLERESIYFDTKESRYCNVAIDQGWAWNTRTEQQLIEAVKRCTSQPLKKEPFLLSLFRGTSREPHSFS